MNDIRPRGHGAVMTILRVIAIATVLLVIGVAGLVSCEIDRAVTKWQVER